MSDPRETLGALHDAVERDAAALAALHGKRLQCRRGCHECCVDELTVFEVEAAAIRDAFPELLATGVPHAAGACAFLDPAGACRIYAARPYVCRTQGLPLRWVADDDEVEYRDICPLNEPGPELTDLPEHACWTLGPWETRLAALQERSGEPGARVALRALFRDQGLE